MDLEGSRIKEGEQCVLICRERSKVELGGTRTSFLFYFPGTGKNKKLEGSEDDLEV